MGELASADEIISKMADVQARIRAAGGDPERIVTIGVTKAFPPELIGRALGAGLVDLGENYGQELETKAAWLASARTQGAAAAAALPEPRWHFIGGLQRNKVRQLASLVHIWHSVDRASLVDEIAKRAPGARILVQVNTTAEIGKSGCFPNDAPKLAERASAAGLHVLGLMTVGPTDADMDPRPGFAALARLAGDLGLAEISMGMSGDFEDAVAEGATMIRVGTVLFGSRPRREPPPGTVSVRN